MLNVDIFLTSAIYNFFRNDIFDFLTLFFHYFIYVIPFVLILAFLYFKKTKEVTVLFLGIALDFLISSLIKFLVNRPRPYDLFDSLFSARGSSFPSLHASMSFLIASILSGYYKKYRIAFYVLALLISLSRIYAGVHYFSDVAFGILLGFLIGKVLITKKDKIYSWLKKYKV